mmetsp:Transcript_41263/g.133848  ORF Transcript_41263/g.133848 Transcript_41263/m.133848 type:complete len:212 (+) Transcript_41263:1815-2450(+)
MGHKGRLSRGRRHFGASVVAGLPQSRAAEQAASAEAVSRSETPSLMRRVSGSRHGARATRPPASSAPPTSRSGRASRPWSRRRPCRAGSCRWERRRRRLGPLSCRRGGGSTRSTTTSFLPTPRGATLCARSRRLPSERRTARWRPARSGLTCFGCSGCESSAASTRTVTQSRLSHCACLSLAAPRFSAPAARSSSLARGRGTRSSGGRWPT